MSSGQDNSMPTSFDISGEDRDMGDVREMAANISMGMNKRAGSPSLKSSAPPKRFQQECKEHLAPSHVATQQQRRPLQAAMLCTPAWRESPQQMNTASGASPLAIDRRPSFQPPSMPQYREPDPRYFRPERHVMVNYGPQSRPNPDGFSQMGPVTPQMQDPGLHGRQGWDRLNDPNMRAVPAAIREFDGRSEIPPRHQRPFRRQAIERPSSIYESGGGRRHNVVDLTSPAGEQRLYQTAPVGRASTVPPPRYQANPHPQSQKYSANSIAYHEKSRLHANNLVHSQRPHFESHGVSHQQLELRNLALDNRTRPRSTQPMDPISAPAPARLRQQGSYNGQDMTRHDQRARERDHLTRFTVTSPTPVITRDASSSRVMNEDFDRQRRLSNRQEKHLRGDEPQEESYMQIMQRSIAAASTQSSRPITRAPPIPTEGLNLRHTVSAFEADSNARTATLSRAREDNHLKMQRSAAEKIMELEQQGKEYEGFDDIFEESPDAKASAARIEKSIMEDSNRKHRREEDQMAKNLKHDYQELLDDVRKKKLMLDRQAKREERRARITDEERRLAKEKEAERLERKRIAAEEVLERSRRERQELVLNETVKKLQAEREAAKKQATSLRPARMTGLLPPKHADETGGQESSNFSMFINSDDDDFPVANDIGKPIRCEAKNDPIRMGKNVGAGTTGAKPPDVTVAALNRTTIAGIASDDRRRPPPARQPQPVPTRPRTRAKEARESTAGDRRMESLLKKTMQDLEKTTAASKAAEEARKKQWDEMLPQLFGALKAQEEPAAITRRQAMGSGFASGAHGAARPGLFNPARGKATALTSQIKFVSQVEREAKEREESEKAEKAAYEKARRAHFQRTNQEIRRVLQGQGVVIDEERIKKTLEDKMATWEETRRRKKERRNNANKLTDSTSSQIENADTSLTGAGPSNDSAETHASEEDIEAKRREEEVRAGLNYLRAKNTAANGFIDAASKSVVQELESEESEEDPDDDDEVEAPPGPEPSTPKAGTEKPFWLSAGAPSTDPTDESRDTENVKTTTALVPAVDKPPAGSDSLTLPAIINPDEKDLIYTYNVNQRSERGEKSFDTLILASFHDLDEANIFAQQKTSELIYNPDLSQIAREETFDRDGRFIGKAVNDKDNNSLELVWVSQVIAYIGDVSNLTPSDMKPTKPCRVFNVIQTTREPNKTPECRVLATTTLKTLANQKASDSFIALCKPRKPEIDMVHKYNHETIPAVRALVVELDRKDECASLEGEDEEAGLWFKLEVCEAEVEGPRN